VFALEVTGMLLTALFITFLGPAFFGLGSKDPWDPAKNKYFDKHYICHVKS